MLEPIARIPPELAESVSSLVEVASILRVVLTEVLRESIARDPEAALPSIVAENRESLELAEIVIGAWREHLGLDRIH